ncbi:hypothetical protein [Clostridium sp. Marseille-P299]|uniref:hypothetical protein n=1 Tax=Clostridium sp. Marseille-P299 TaxID=1805477 RepID=UPI00082FA75C|nr:hypothetical protein [Clostridium sp. Marseille-P299]
MLKSFSKKQMRFFILFAILICVLVAAGYLIIGRKNSKYKHIDKNYFTMTTKVELRDLPWTINPEEAKKVIGELDTTYDVEPGEGIKVIERLMPKKQIYIDELDISTEVIRLLFNIKDELMSFDYYFKCDSYDEALTIYNELEKYLSECISSDITKNVNDTGNRIRWIDDEGNYLILEGVSQNNLSNGEAYVTMNFQSFEHKVIYPDE